MILNLVLWTDLIDSSSTKEFLNKFITRKKKETNKKNHKYSAKTFCATNNRNHYDTKYFHNRMPKGLTHVKMTRNMIPEFLWNTPAIDKVIAIRVQQYTLTTMPNFPQNYQFLPFTDLQIALHNWRRWINRSVKVLRTGEPKQKPPLHSYKKM